ncbi:hypothetical protein IWW34DRAFT_723452 [Fusarium oxysporum f. sp. albedinis]|nr:hypothetical protein IWW34DRAFT_723452 [Fusarium oxysporum f. sp. albedinis]
MPILPCLSWISGCMCKQAVSLLFLTTFDPRFIIKTNQYPKESHSCVATLDNLFCGSGQRKYTDETEFWQFV